MNLGLIPKIAKFSRDYLIVYRCLCCYIIVRWQYFVYVLVIQECYYFFYYNSLTIYERLIGIYYMIFVITRPESDSLSELNLFLLRNSDRRKSSILYALTVSHLTLSLGVLIMSYRFWNSLRFRLL